MNFAKDPEGPLNACLLRFSSESTESCQN